jgi:CRISPR/Cas system-associated endonuclease Cas1
MKTLYLDGCRGLEVRLDGPALRVRQSGRAEGQYPLTRVARIVAVGRVQWRPEALSACLREHKPVAVLDSRGRFVRALFERPPSQFGLARRMAGLLEIPRFRARYEDWFRSTERREVMWAAEQLDLNARNAEPDRFRHAVRREQRRRWAI